MMNELKVTQPEGDWKRRWFADEFFDLIVWLNEDASIHGFQLCYDKQGYERAMTWTQDRGFTHNKVDSGEEIPMRNRTPILVADGLFHKDEILRRFRESSAEIDPEIRNLVIDKVTEFHE